MTESADLSISSFVEVAELAVVSLTSVADRNWSVAAGDLEWSCWQTLDHLVDCVLSYALQLAGRAQTGWLALQELHALPSATPPQLVEAFGAVSQTFVAVVRAAPERVTASDGLHELDIPDWVARATFEVLLHVHDVLTGLGGRFEPPPEVCAATLASPALWGIDRARGENAVDAWDALLVVSGRAGRRQ